MQSDDRIFILGEISLKHDIDLYGWFIRRDQMNCMKYKWMIHVDNNVWCVEDLLHSYIYVIGSI